MHANRLALAWIVLSGVRRPYLATVSLAGVERAGGIVSGHVPVAAHDVVDVLAESGGVRTILARPDTELVIRHKVL